jgi:hypothetical protein
LKKLPPRPRLAEDPAGPGRVSYPTSRRGLLVRLASTCAAMAVSPLGTHAQNEGDHRTPEWYARAVQSQGSAAREYTFDATVELGRRSGEDPRESVGDFTIRLAVAPAGKFLLLLGDYRNPKYVIASDGQRTWGVNASAKQYVEFEAIATGLGSQIGWAFAGGVTKEVDPIICARLAVPILANLDPVGTTVVDMMWPGGTEVNREDETHDPPVLTVLSSRTTTGAQTLTRVIFDPVQFRVRGVEWIKGLTTGEESTFALLTYTYSRFDLAAPVPASYFTYIPGSEQKVEQLAIPGLDGANVLGLPAPDLELETVSGIRRRISEYRGRVLLVAFSAAACKLCMNQWAAISAIAPEYSTRGVAFLAAHEGAPGAHTRFGVHFVPTLVIIDRNGIVSQFVPGFRDASGLRNLLQRALG